MSLSRTATRNRKTLDPPPRLARPLGASWFPRSGPYDAHLSTADPLDSPHECLQAHILSPSSDVDSPSFVASCQYSFELFFLPPPPPSAAPDQERIPNKTKHLESSTAASSETATESEEAKEDGSRTSHNARIPPSDSDPPAIATSSLPAAYESTYLSPTWPESTERDRVLVRGWSALENAVCWGRREQVMREAIRQARHWIEEEQQGEQGEEQELGRIPNAEQRQSVEVKPA